MTAVLSLTQPQLRPLDPRRDLAAVADLIELCFSGHMDADGREYIRYLRRLARSLSLFPWSVEVPERSAGSLYGYVWVEEGKVVGNLSLIPLRRQNRPIYLIANVAVHPDFRGRGIARALTERALRHSAEHGAAATWLEVRDDNPVAIHIYRSLGFIERARRNTWIINPMNAARPAPLPAGFAISAPRRADWAKFADGLSKTYPDDVIWNLPLRLSRLEPGWWKSLQRFFNGEIMRSWALRFNDAPVAYLAWEPGRLASDFLWLTCAPEWEETTVRTLLPRALQNLSNRRTLTLNYPAGQAVTALAQAGFSLHNTLLWMEAPVPV